MHKQASGTRKKAVARATLSKGTGKVRVNKLGVEKITPRIAQQKIMEPLWIAGDAAKSVDIEISTLGGGVISQAEATRVAIARALVAHDKKLEKAFIEYDRNLLVPDSRQKEAVKPNTQGRARAKKPKGKR